MVITTNMGIRCRQFGVTQSANQRHCTTQEPNKQRHHGTFHIGGDEGWCLKNTNTDNNAND
jgi:hypothetical protein